MPADHLRGQCWSVWRTREFAGTAVTERHDEASLPSGWGQRDLRVARALGDRWIRDGRSAVLVVPSVVAGRERNVVLNPQHLDFRKIAVGLPEPVIWDARLFRQH